MLVLPVLSDSSNGWIKSLSNLSASSVPIYSAPNSRHTSPNAAYGQPFSRYSLSAWWWSYLPLPMSYTIPSNFSGTSNPLVISIPGFSIFKNAVANTSSEWNLLPCVKPRKGISIVLLYSLSIPALSLLQ